MASINIQFHGLPSEIIDFAEECARDYELNPVIVQLFPEFKAIFDEDINLRSSINKPTQIDQIHLLVTKPDMSINDYMMFLDKNPDKLVFSIGKYDNERLTESALSGITDNPELFDIWKKIGRKLKAITLTGAWVINPESGNKSFYKNHRYTIAAKKAFEDGLKILPVGGWNYYVLKAEREHSL